MNLDLAKKKALVTGSSSGLGEAIAKLLAQEGATVVVHGRNETRVNQVVADIRNKGGKAEGVLGDLATDEGANQVAESVQKSGPIDILVNNAGVYRHLGWMEGSPKVWAETYQVNVISAVRMIQKLVLEMRKARWGRVIQIGGALAQQPIAAQPDYYASMAARHNLAVSLARELKESGVTSNVVSPGAMRVESVEALLKSLAPKMGWGPSWDEIEVGAARDFVPNDIGRLRRPEEIAGAVAYLCSPFADYISGAVIRVDGGMVRAAF
jgi:3-oxoacyl-[acyl-carrier protein] reductase